MTSVVRLDGRILWDTLRLDARAHDRGLPGLLNDLVDHVARAKIQVRVDRLVHGNPGRHRNLSSGISELKVDYGPGYRVYYTKRGSELVILLVGGDKASQRRDVRLAIELARNL